MPIPLANEKRKLKPVERITDARDIKHDTVYRLELSLSDLCSKVSPAVVIGALASPVFWSRATRLEADAKIGAGAQIVTL